MCNHDSKNYQQPICKECGEPIPYRREGSGRQKIFCTQNCSQTATRRRSAELQGKPFNKGKRGRPAKIS